MTPVPSRPLALYLTHRVPFPPDKGDRIRNYHLLREMSRRGRVWLGCLADEPVEPATIRHLEQFAERVRVIPVSSRRRWPRAFLSLARGRSLSEGLFSEPALRRVIREWTAETEFDVAVVSASSLAPYLWRDGLERVPGVVDLVDVDSQKWFDFAAATSAPKRWLYQLEGRRIRKLERSLPKRTRAVGLVSRAEASLYDEIAGPGAATAAANGVDLDYYQPTPSIQPIPQTCAFVGALDYLPNVDAAVWFAEAVWPRIRAEYPTARFRLIGRKPAPAVRKLASKPGIEVIGQVPDVRPHVAAVEVVVVPLRLARGLQNKVLEALAMGKPTVASHAALAALRPNLDADLVAASTPAEWLAGVCGFFSNPDRARTFGAAGRRFVETHHHWDRCLQPLIDRIFPPVPGAG